MAITAPKRKQVAPSRRRQVRPGTRLTREQRQRVAKAILAEFDIAEAVHLIVELGLGWGEPYDREQALGIRGLSVEEAIDKVSADLRAAFQTDQGSADKSATADNLQ